MPDRALKKLAELIAMAENIDLRRAAILVAGHLGEARDGVLVKTLAAGMTETDVGLRIAAIEALGRLRAQSVLPQLIEEVRRGGAEVEAASRAAGQMGAKGAAALEKVMADATPVVRRRIASALGGTESAALAAAHALLDEDPGVVDAAARALAAELPAAGDAQRRALAAHLRSSLKKGRKPPLPAASEAAMLRVLSGIHDAKAEGIFWACLNPRKPANVRAAALQALGGLPPPKGKTELERLLNCAMETDFQIAAPALLILKNIQVNAKNVKRWLPLLQAPDAATRRFAVEKLQGIDTAETTRALAGQLKHPDRALREQVLAALSQSKSGRQTLTRALMEAESQDEAWSLARAQGAFARELPKPLRKRLFKQACEYWEEDDRRADALWFLLREMDAGWTRKQMETRALSLRQKRDYNRALSYLRLLARDPAIDEDTRFELAATGLKLSNRDPAPEARQADPSLHQFTKLLQNPDFNLIGHVKKAKWLGPEELFYLGFHFAEQNRREKEFGGQVLQLIIQRSSRTQLAKDAKRKLKSEGLD